MLFRSKAIKDLAYEGADGIIIADDLAFNEGLMIRPEKLRNLFMWSIESQVNEILDSKMVPFFHSDGYYIEILDDVLDLGFKGINCIDRNSNMTLESLGQYTDKLCLWGHLDYHDINDSIQRHNMEEMVDYIRKHTDFNSFIFGTNSGLFSGLDIDQLKKIYEYIDLQLGQRLKSKEQV